MRIKIKLQCDRCYQYECDAVFEPKYSHGFVSDFSVELVDGIDWKWDDERGEAKCPVCCRPIDDED